MSHPTPISLWTLDETLGIIAGDTFGGNPMALVSGLNFPTDTIATTNFAGSVNGLKVNDPSIVGEHGRVLGDPGNLKITNQLSVSLWQRHGQSTAKELISKLDATGAGLSWLFRTTGAAGGIEIQLSGDGTTNPKFYQDAIPLFTGLNNSAWRHVGFTLDVSANSDFAPNNLGRLRVYVDGINVTRASAFVSDTALAALFNTAADVLLASILVAGVPLGATNHKCDFDDVAIWNVALTDAEMLDVKNTGAAVFSATAPVIANIVGTQKTGNRINEVEVDYDASDADNELNGRIVDFEYSTAGGSGPFNPATKAVDYLTQVELGDGSFGLPFPVAPSSKKVFHDILADEGPGFSGTVHYRMKLNDGSGNDSNVLVAASGTAVTLPATFEKKITVADAGADINSLDLATVEAIMNAGQPGASHDTAFEFKPGLTYTDSNDMNMGLGTAGWTTKAILRTDKALNSAFNQATLNVKLLKADGGSSQTNIVIEEIIVISTDNTQSPFSAINGGNLTTQNCYIVPGPNANGPDDAQLVLIGSAANSVAKFFNNDIVFQDAANLGQNKIRVMDNNGPAGQTSIFKNNSFGFFGVPNASIALEFNSPTQPTTVESNRAFNYKGGQNATFDVSDPAVTGINNFQDVDPVHAADLVQLVGDSVATIVARDPILTVSSPIGPDNQSFVNDGAVIIALTTDRNNSARPIGQIDIGSSEIVAPNVDPDLAIIAGPTVAGNGQYFMTLCGQDADSDISFLVNADCEVSVDGTFGDAVDIVFGNTVSFPITGLAFVPSGFLFQVLCDLKSALGNGINSLVAKMRFKANDGTGDSNVVTTAAFHLVTTEGQPSPPKNLQKAAAGVIEAVDVTNGSVQPSITSKSLVVNTTGLMLIKLLKDDDFTEILVNAGKINKGLAIKEVDHEANVTGGAGAAAKNIRLLS